MDEVKQDIKRGVPAPGTYNPNIRDKVIGPIKSSSPQGQFIMDAEYIGQSSLAPGHYKPNFS
jgi:exosome complex RNA-binding protein Rrp4